MPATRQIPPTREANLERFFRERVRAIGGMILKLVPVNAGAPDRLVMLPPSGQMYLVELKTETGQLRPIQRVWHSKARAIGLEPVTLYGREEMSRWVRDRAAEMDEVYHPAKRPGRRRKTS